MRRQVCFRLLAVALGLAAVALVEVALRQTSWGRVRDLGDPFVGFSEVKPLFVLNEAGDRYEIPKSRQAFFQPESFAARKAHDEFRIFCLGGSTVQGRPYSTETSFTTWLELSLKAADPSRDWEVVNCGGVSYASYRLVPIMKEALAYDPDLFIIYTGHNEFLEDRSYARMKQVPDWIQRGHEWLTRLRTYGLLRQLYLGVDGPGGRQGDRPQLAAEVDALLDYRGGLKDYHRDDAWRLGVIAHFEQNLRRMVRISRYAHVPVVLANPVSDLKDTPPFKTAVRQDLTAQQSETFERCWNEARESGWERLDRKAALLEQVLAIDDRHAEAHFLLGRVYDAMGRFGAARQEYIRAKDEDICPLRILEPMHEVIARVARRTRTPLVDIRRMFDERAEHGIPGHDLLIDHVHPRIEGHQMIAGMLFEELVRQGMATRRPGWETRQDQLYQQRWQTLQHNYFPESVARLRGLQKWAAGRAAKLKVANARRPGTAPGQPTEASPQAGPD